jgi:hypothetical protein
MKNNDAQNKVDQLGDDIKKQFEQIGNDIKQQMLKDFNSKLNSDLSNLRSVLGKIVEAQSKNALKQSEQNLQKTIINEFGGSLFSQFLSGSSDSTGGDLRSNDFRAAAGQSLLAMGSAIARAQMRNG